MNNIEYQHFLNLFTETLNKHSTMKQTESILKEIYDEITTLNSRFRNDFWVIGEKCVEKNTKNNEIFA